MQVVDYECHNLSCPGFSCPVQTFDFCTWHAVSAPGASCLYTSRSGIRSLLLASCFWSCLSMVHHYVVQLLVAVRVGHYLSPTAPYRTCHCGS